MNEVIYSTSQNQYASYEKASPSQYTRRCIDSTITGCNKCLGYCRYDGHPGFLTEKHMRVHDCIAKECHYLVCKPQREKKRSESMVDQSENILIQLQSIMLSECIKVIRVQNSTLNRYTAYYVTITNECCFDDCTQQIRDNYNADIEFVKLNYDFDTCLSILCAK